MFTRVSQLAEIRQVADLAREIWTEHYTPIIGAQQVAYMLERFQSVEAVQAQLAAYEKLGFQKVAEQITDIGNGFVMDDYVMENEFHP